MTSAVDRVFWLPDSVASAVDSELRWSHLFVGLEAGSNLQRMTPPSVRGFVEYLHALEGGEEWAKAGEAGTPGEAADATANAAELAARLLPVSMRLGRRQRAWDSVDTDSSEFPMESWPVDGSSVALWVIMLLPRFAGGGPEVYHRWRMSIAQLMRADWGVAEHSHGLVEWIAAELQKTGAITKAPCQACGVRSLAKTTVSCEQPFLLAILPPAAYEADQAGEGGGKNE